MLSRIATVARHPVALWLSAIAIATWAIARATRFREGAPFVLWGDAGIVFGKSSEILRSARYPASVALGNFNDVFPYPPPAALLFGAIASLGAPIFMASWTLLMIAGLFAAFRFSVVNESLHIKRAFVALMPLIIILVHNPIEFDLVNDNNNLIVLALVMASFALMTRAPVAAGLLLALPIAIKLYSAALVLWLVVYRPRAAIACAVALGALWIVLPLGIFGAADAVALYRGWLDQIAIVNHPWVYELPAGQGPPLISLRRAAAWFSNRPPYATETAVTLRAMQAAWVAVLAVYAMQVWRAGKVRATSRAALSDWAIVLLAPLPFSPWLEPYHAVSMIPAFVLCVLVLFDDTAPNRERLITGAVCGVVLAIKAAGTPFEIRGFVFLIQFALLVLALGSIRRVLARNETEPISRPNYAAVAGGSASTE